MSIESAVCYRMVLYIAGTTVANAWGYKPESLGYKEAERIFNGKYKLISFTQLKDEIILSWCAESVKRKNKKMSMLHVLDIDETNEEYRPIFNRVTEKVKDQYKENTLKDIPEAIKEEESEIDKIIKDIDSTFDKVLEEASEGDNNLHFSNDELEKLVFAVEKVGRVKEDLNGYDLDIESFLEGELKAYNKKMVETNMPQRIYNEEVARLIKTNFFARLNTVQNNNNPGSRNRTKESIYERIQDGTIHKMSVDDFSFEYIKLIELYDECDNKATNIDGLVMFYDIEDKYNLIFYNNVVSDLVEDTATAVRKKELAEKISKLALCDLYIYRSSTMKAIANKVIYDFHNEEDKTYKEVINEISVLLRLKNKIVDDMLLISTLVFQDLKENAFNAISDTAKEEIHQQIKKVDIERYLDIESDKKILYKVFRIIKYLLERNRDILLERNSIINKLKV